MDNNPYPIYQPHSHGIIYSPWREDYDKIVAKAPHAEQKKSDISCRLCNALVENKDDLIVYRGKNNSVMLASQPYISSGAHLLIVPHEHTRELKDLSRETYDEENILTQKICTFFARDYHTICLNTNQGIAAGASVPTHHHKHIIVQTTARTPNLIQAIEQTKTSINLQQLSSDLQRHMKLTDIKAPLLTQIALHNFHCYFCSIMKDTAQDQRNLVIHRGKKASILLSHYPTYFGQLEIIPHDHYTALETMDKETYDEINELTIKIYPLLLNILGTEDSNIGLNSYGTKAEYKEHIRQRIIPRKQSWVTSPITQSNHISSDVLTLYKRLLLEWKKPAKM